MIHLVFAVDTVYAANVAVVLKNKFRRVHRRGSAMLPRTLRFCYL